MSDGDDLDAACTGVRGGPMGEVVHHSWCPIHDAPSSDDARAK
jgi:hypothetical protein